MMDTAIVPARNNELARLSAQTMELVLQGDLSKLTATQRVEYYLARCEAAGLDPRTKPFDYLLLNGKLQLYANATAAQQAAEKRRLSLQIASRERVDDVYVVTCRVTDPTGRYTESIGAVTIGTLKGDALANGLMKAETKAKRRAVLSFCGLGMIDETELETIPGAVRMDVNTETGELLAPALMEPTESEPRSVPPAADEMDHLRRKYHAQLTEHFGKLDDHTRHCLNAVLLGKSAPISLSAKPDVRRYRVILGVLEHHCEHCEGGDRCDTLIIARDMAKEQQP